VKDIALDANRKDISKEIVPKHQNMMQQRTITGKRKPPHQVGDEVQKPLKPQKKMTVEN